MCAKAEVSSLETAVLVPERDDTVHLIRHGGIVARAISPAPRDRWRDILASDPDAEISQSPEWLDGIVAAGGLIDCSCLYDFGGGREVVFAMAARSGRPAWSTTGGSWPERWGDGGAVVRGGNLREHEIQFLFEELRSHGWLRAHISPPFSSSAIWDAAAPSWAIRSRHTNQRVDLS